MSERSRLLELIRIKNKTQEQWEELFQISATLYNELHDEYEAMMEYSELLYIDNKKLREALGLPNFEDELELQ